MTGLVPPRYTGEVTKPLSRRARSLRRSALALATTAVLLPSLTGCFILDWVTPQAPARQAPEPPAEPPVFVPDGSASDNLPVFQETLREYAEGEGAVQGQPIVDAVSGVGFDKAAMQVSFDQSQTGLAADSIFVSVRIGEECLIGQIAAEGRDSAAEVMPAVGPENNVCLIGATRPIDW